MNAIEMPLPPAMVNTKKKKQNDRTSTQEEENTDLFIESLCVCVCVCFAEMQIDQVNVAFVLRSMGFDSSLFTVVLRLARERETKEIIIRRVCTSSRLSFR